MFRTLLIIGLAAALAACVPASAPQQGEAHVPAVAPSPAEAPVARVGAGQGWAYQPLMQVRRCEIGAFTYNGKSYLVASGINSSCALTPAPR